MPATLDCERTSAVVIAEATSFNDVRRCAQLGVMDYLAAPVAPGELLELAERARKHARYVATSGALLISPKEPARTVRGVDGGQNARLIGGSAAMLALYKKSVRIPIYVSSSPAKPAPARK